MFENVVPMGFDLVEENNTWHYQINNQTVFKGDLKSVVSYMITTQGFEIDHIEEVLLEMNELGHNAAHFGVFCSMIFTYETKRAS